MGTASRAESPVRSGRKRGHEGITTRHQRATPLIAPGKTATLIAPLKAGPIELYCTVPGHKQAGMDLKLTVS